MVVEAPTRPGLRALRDPLVMYLTRVLVTGGTGLLGWSLVRLLSEKGYKVVATHHMVDPPQTLGAKWIRVDFSKPGEGRRVVEAIKPNIVVHAAAYTDVDGCEEHKELAYCVNYLATAELAKACRGVCDYFVYISTDYVFDGEKGLYREAETVVAAAHAVYKEHVYLLADYFTLKKWLSKKALRLSAELGVEKALEAATALNEAVDRGVMELPLKIPPAHSVRAYLHKLARDPGFRATLLNALEYLGTRRVGRVVAWRLTRKAY